MGKIQVLSDLLANKIAAGEVVERPASVIKELLENAIDAGSTEIIIEVEQGGLDLIKVSDNGIGMEKDDALTAFERHATSKIRNERDLFKIRTLGFRGEALPSIASVSKVEIRTRTQEANEGTLVKIEGGKLIAHTVTAAKKGTEFAVRDLFFNTPARLKYLKTIQTEVGHMLDYVNRLALAHPDISFRMYQNGRQAIHTPGDGNLLHAIASIYGQDVARQMLPVEWESYDYKIAGAVGFPELNRANRNHCSFFVNGRYIKSYQLLNAVQNAYHTRLPINRYPVCVISLELDPTLVDVNVHPNKLEVRFSEERDVMHAVQQAVEEVLQKQTFIPKASAKSVNAGEKEKTQQASFDLSIQPQGQGQGAAGQTPASQPSPQPQPGSNGPKYRDPLPHGGTVVRETPLPKEYQARREAPLRQQIDAAMGAYRATEPGQGGPGQPPSTMTGAPASARSTADSQGSQQPNLPADGLHRAAPDQQQTDATQTSGQQKSVATPEQSGNPDASGTPAATAAMPAQTGELQAEGILAVLAVSTASSTQQPLPAQADPALQHPAPPRPNVPQFRPVAQVLGMYVIAQDDTGLYIIDQHAAHEKVLYEKFNRRLTERTIQPLQLLVPYTFELTAAESALLEQRVPLLADYEIEVERFGGTTFLVRTVPDIWEGLEVQSLLQELIDELLQEGSTPDPRKLIEGKVITKACKSAIKANQWLSMPEMTALCDQLRELENPFTCPHGRPIIIHMSNYDLEKQFKRVM